MSYEEWVKSLDLPSGIGVSASEAYQAGIESVELRVKKIWDRSLAMGEFAEDVVSLFTLTK